MTDNLDLSPAGLADWCEQAAKNYERHPGLESEVTRWRACTALLRSVASAEGDAASITAEIDRIGVERFGAQCIWPQKSATKVIATALATRAAKTARAVEEAYQRGRRDAEK